MADAREVWVCGVSSFDGGTVSDVLATRDDARRWIEAEHSDRLEAAERRNQWAQDNGRQGIEEISDVAEAEDRIAFSGPCDTWYAQRWPVGVFPPPSFKRADAND